RARPQHRGTRRGGGPQPHAQEQGFRPGPDLHRPAGPPDAQVAAVVGREAKARQPARGDPGDGSRAQLIVVSGMSGSGKSVALRTLEDLDFYCVDNLPVALMPAFVESLTRDPGARDRRLAVGIDARNRSLDL